MSLDLYKTCIITSKHLNTSRGINLNENASIYSHGFNLYCINLEIIFQQY
jgi:hypothetical protein